MFDDELVEDNVVNSSNNGITVERNEKIESLLGLNLLREICIFEVLHEKVQKYKRKEELPKSESKKIES